MLLELAAVLGGSFTMSVMTPLWQLAEGGDDESLNKALMVAMKKKMLTSMSSKGYAPVGRNRKSSIGENMVFAFVHLRILDVAKSALLKQQKISLHEIAYEVLSSPEHGAPDEELAVHKEAAGDLLGAADLFLLAAKTVGFRGGDQVVASGIMFRAHDNMHSHFDAIGADIT